MGSKRLTADIIGGKTGERIASGRLIMKDARPVRVLIAEHRATTRSALKLLLEEKLRLQIVGEAADGKELLAMIHSVQPDIVVIEWGLPGAPAADLLTALQALDRRPKALALVTYSASVPEALAAGADAAVRKCDPPKRVLAAVHMLSTES